MGWWLWGLYSEILTDELFSFVTWFLFDKFHHLHYCSALIAASLPSLVVRMASLKYVNSSPLFLNLSNKSSFSLLLVLMLTSGSEDISHYLWLKTRKNRWTGMKTFRLCLKYNNKIKITNPPIHFAGRPMHSIKILLLLLLMMVLLFKSWSLLNTNLQLYSLVLYTEGHKAVVIF